MRNVLTKYRGPVAACFAFVVAASLWIWAQWHDALERQQHEELRHSESLAKGLRILADCVDAERPAKEAAFLRALRDGLDLGPPIRFAVITRGARILATLGHRPPMLRMPPRPGLHGVEELFVARHTLVGRQSGGDSTMPLSHPGAPWRWNRRARADQARLPPMVLYVGMDASLPTHGWERLIQRVAMLLGAAFLALAALVFAWVRSIRTRTLASRLDAEQRERARLEELNLAAAGLAHETKNPLGLILGLTHRLADRADSSAETRETLEQIMDEADRATARLSDFINFARIAEPRWGQAELGQLVAHIAAALRPDFDAAGVELALDVDEVSIACDTAMLEQVIVNLLLNSLQASEAGSTTTVRVTRRGDQVTLRVADKGKGIALALQPDVFKPYVSGRAAGHGLGLAIVRQIVQQHGWAVALRSQPGRGTEVSISGLRVVAKAATKEGPP